ncbi:unnamed protein product [Caenorhabditis auriculariae]|uniref:Ubiquitin carboxyl-terminal hydrolase n=1 Tax=Caenorhabditis auriculariae TaxID=2777116 RepID=A0A8S1GW90_9PELO|nr:unnamed protein product [Caenorhabditis auriculariae]
MVLVNVKWGREKYEVDLNIDESPLLFKSQLFALTNVLPDRQKLLAKGRTIGDESWEGLTVTPGMMFMMMGSSAPIPQAPVPGGFDKDDHPLEPRKAVILPLGLGNLGNTCYFNSVLQMLQVVPEVHSTLKATKHPRISLLSEMSKTFTIINDPEYAEDNTHVQPFVLLETLRTHFPQFGSVSASGTMEQQDANECYTVLLNTVLASTDRNTESRDNARKYFGGRFEVKTKCIESEEEEVTTSSETFYQLSCFLNQDVKYIQTGIKCGMKEEIEKYSNVLGRNSKWLKEELIARLPKYVSIQLVRFFYKENSQTSAKVLKDVKFPMMLDLYDVCTPELQAKLQPMRACIKEEEDAKIEIEQKKKLMDKDEAKKFKDNGEVLPSEFEDDIGSNNSGFYELQAVVSHKGRTVKSGHYVAWIKSEGKWLLCDDENVTPVDAENVLKTSGGGDWHTAYILLYGARQVKKYPAPAAEPEPMN